MFFVTVYSKQTQSCMLILSCKHTHLFEMMGHLYSSSDKLFNCKYVHIVKPNVRNLNKYFSEVFLFSFVPDLVQHTYCSHRQQIDDVKGYTLSHHLLKTGTNDHTVQQFRCVSAAEHHSAEQYYKIGRTKLRKHFSRSNESLNILYDLDTKLPWKPSGDATKKASWNQMSRGPPNTTWSSD